MMPVPKVTIYITNFNYGKYLQQAIESVLSQTLKETQILVIDDGSTDESRSVMELYKAIPNIQLIYQKNRGLNITNNIALRLAQGLYIVRLDADDYLEPDALEKMVSMLDGDSELGLVFPDYHMVDQSGQLLETVHRLDFQHDVKLLDQPAHGACTMIRRSFLDDLGGYDESYRCQDGYELWIKFTSRHKVRNINQPLFSYRQHGSNLTSNERRILNTRMNIKNDFIKKNEMVLPRALALIPVRETRIAGEILAYAKINGEPLIYRKISALLQVEGLKKIVIAAVSNDIKEFVEEGFPGNDRIVFVRRSEEAARHNASLLQTIKEVLSLHEIEEIDPEAVLIAALEYPFVRSESYRDAINTLAIFGADSLVSVRPDSTLMYQHHGSGMVPILGQEKFTKLEREALYRSAGGILLTRISSMNLNESILHGLVGHIVVDQLASFGIGSTFDLEACRVLASLSDNHQ